MSTRRETDFVIAEQVFRRENPRRFPFSPWGKQLELRDLWPSDQAAYIDRVRLIREELEARP